MIQVAPGSDQRQITSKSYEWLIAVIAITVVAVIAAVIFRPEAQVQAFGFGGVICVAAFGLLKIGQKMDVAAEKIEVVAEKAEEVRTTLIDSNKETADNIAIVKTTAEEAAKHVVEVRDTLVESGKQRTAQLNSIQTTGEETHALANGALTASMKVGAVALRRLAAISKDPDDMTAADLAEKALQEHVAKQLNGSLN